MSAEDKTIPTVKHIRARVERLERAALACRVFATVQYFKVTRFHGLKRFVSLCRIMPLANCAACFDP